MLYSTILLGWVGILIFLIIIFSLRSLVKNNEYGLIHILMAIMYAMWLPVPLALYFVLDIDFLIVGSTFGFVYLMMLVMTMALQTGHIAYVRKQNDVPLINANNIMATLSNPFEALANVFKSIWALFLGVSFWSIGATTMAVIMFLSSSLIFYYLILAINTSLVKQIDIFSKVKANSVVTNFETLLFFIALMSYISFSIFG